MAVIDGPERAALAKKISEIVKSIGYIEKTGRNADQGYKYASAALVFDEVNDAAYKNGVLILSTCSDIVHEEISSTKGTRGLQTTMKVQVEFIDTDNGFSLSGEFPAVGVDYGDKSASKAITSGRRHAVLGALGIPTGTDPDASDPEPQKAAPSIASCYRVWAKNNNITEHVQGRKEFKAWVQSIGIQAPAEDWVPSPADRIKIADAIGAGK